MNKADFKSPEYELGEIVEEEVGEIILQHELTITSPAAELIVPVFLDENLEWFFERESLMPLLDINLEAECLKSIREDTSKGQKLIACYPVTDTIKEFLSKSALLLRSGIKLSRRERIDVKEGNSVVELPELFHNISLQ